MMGNVFEKLQEAKLLLAQANVKKSGMNTFSKFPYYELSDFLPLIVTIFDKLKLCSIVSFTSESATLTIINTENPEERETITSPMVSGFEIKGANPMQAMGGIQTYQRRYLYMAALDITENDLFDANVGKPDAKAKNETLPTCDKCGMSIGHVNKCGKLVAAADVKKGCGGLCVKCYKEQSAINEANNG